MNGFGYLVAGAAAGFLLAKATQPRQQRVLYQCEEQQPLNLRSGAASILTLCQACDQMEPVLRPMSQGRVPPIDAIRAAFF